MKSILKMACICGYLIFCFPIMTTAAPAGYVVYWGHAPNAAAANPIGLVEVGGQIVSNATAIAAGNGSALAIRSDSTVVGWGWNNHGQATGVPTAERTSGVVTLNGQILSNIVKVSTEWIPVMALKDDGSVVAWDGETVTTNVGPIVSLCGRYQFGIKADGTVVDVSNHECLVERRFEIG